MGLSLPHAWPGPQVRAMQRPPPGVKLVIEAVCIMKGIKPKKVPGEKPGSKVDDYWEPGKGLLQDPGRFLENLFKFDKVSTPGPWPASEGGQGPAVGAWSCLSACSTLSPEAMLPRPDPGPEELSGWWGDNRPVNRWALRKSGQAGSHTSLHGSAAWRFPLVPFPPCGPHILGLDHHLSLDHRLSRGFSTRVQLRLSVSGFLCLSGALSVHGQVLS